MIDYILTLFDHYRELRSLWNSDLHRYLIIWISLIFMLFSFSGTKFPHDPMTGLTPVFILFACLIDDDAGRSQDFLPVQSDAAEYGIALHLRFTCA